MDKLGHHFKLIPETVPFEGTFSEVSLDDEETPSVDDFKTTNEVLKQIISDETKFCDLYKVFPLPAESNAGYHIASTSELQF